MLFISNNACQALIPAVEAVLRYIADAMLEGQIDPKDTQNNAVSSKQHATEIIKCLEYLRDRVGVPRDMSYPAARQLRAHLNWAIDQFR